MITASIFVLYAGFTSLCLSMSRHYRSLGIKAPEGRQLTRFKVGGWTLLAVSLALCIGYGESWSLGLVNWLGAATLALLVLVFLFAFHPRKATWLAKASLPCALLLIAGTLFQVP